MVRARIGDRFIHKGNPEKGVGVISENSKFGVLIDWYVDGKFKRSYFVKRLKTLNKYKDKIQWLPKERK